MGKAPSYELNMSSRLFLFFTRRYPKDTIVCVSRDAGIDAATIHGWVQPGHSGPGFVSTLKLVAAYGPEFVAEMLDDPPKWVRDLAAPVQKERLRAEIVALTAQIDAIADSDDEAAR